MGAAVAGDWKGGGGNVDARSLGMFYTVVDQAVLF